MSDLLFYKQACLATNLRLRCDEAELRQIFGQFGEVQTCFPNPEKKHAFIKMYTRASAVHAKDRMQTTQDALILQRIRSVRA